MGFEITGRLGLDGSAFTHGLLRAQQEATGFSNKVMGSFKGIGASVGSQIGASLAAAFSVSTVHRFFDSIMQRVDQIQDLSEQYQITTDEAQQIQSVADESGLKFQNYGRALEKLNSSRSDAIGGNDRLIEKFKKFNVTLEDLRNPQLRSIDLMLKLGAAIKDTALNAKDLDSLKDLLGSGRIIASLPELLLTSKYPKMSFEDISNIKHLQSELKLAENRALVLGGQTFGGAVTRFNRNPIEALTSIGQNPFEYLATSWGFRTKAPDALKQQREQVEQLQAEEYQKRVTAARAALEQAIYKAAFDTLGVKQQEAALETEIKALREKSLEFHKAGKPAESLEAEKEAVEKERQLEKAREAIEHAKVLTDKQKRLAFLHEARGLMLTDAAPRIGGGEERVGGLAGGMGAGTLQDDIRKARDLLARIEQHVRPNEFRGGALP